MINRFEGKYDFLSNFHSSPIELFMLTFPTVEHAYQASKCTDPLEILSVLKCPTPGKAKRMGQKVKIKCQWEHIKLDVMLDLLRRKFRDPDLKKKLIETGDEELVEGNNWNDTYWGVCDGVGQNHLGKLLMQVREEVKSGIDPFTNPDSKWHASC